VGLRAVATTFPAPPPTKSIPLNMTYVYRGPNEKNASSVDTVDVEVMQICHGASNVHTDIFAIHKIKLLQVLDSYFNNSQTNIGLCLDRVN
jgi:hypothetical protein